MNDHEAQRIAAAVHQLRPDWPTPSVLTIIRKNLMDRPRRDVTVALAWVACEANSQTPARVLEAGPWWKAAGAHATGTVRERIGRDERCSICSMPKSKCRQLWADDHDFESMATAAKRKAETDPATVTSRVAALKALLAETPAREPAPPGGLEALADRNPKLRTRVDALRAQLPKPPPMREPEPDPEPAAAIQEPPSASPTERTTQP